MRFTAVLTVALCVGLVVSSGPARAEGISGADVELDVGLDPIGLGEGAGWTAPSPARVRALKAEHIARAKLTPAAAAAIAKTSVVDCTKGQSIQAAIDKDPGPLDIQIKGICTENVRIERKQVTLRGTDPAFDGIRGAVATPAVPALSILYADGVVVRDLSVTNGGTAGVAFHFSNATMERCRVTNSTFSGVLVLAASSLNALELTLAENGTRGLNVQSGAIAFCTGCTLSNNAADAALAYSGALLSLLDSAVSGPRGITSLNDSYADIDCLSSPTTSVPCGMNATRFAARAFGNATAALYGAGDFSGSLLATDRGHVFLYGARQLAQGTNARGFPIANWADTFGTLWAETYVDEFDVAHESQLKGSTIVDSFARALLRSETVIDGSVDCSAAGDAWADPGVVVTSGGSISGCDHASAP